MKKELSVVAIKQGTVIDHIPCGQALHIAKLLRLSHENQVTIGINYVSSKNQLKDLIKLEGKVLTSDEANQITLFAPDATVNIIEDYKVINKLEVDLPSSIDHAFSCPNKNCISNTEDSGSFFYVTGLKKSLKLKCKYCEKAFSQNELKGYFL